MTGWPPPGPPRFVGGFAELRRRRRILSAPLEADRGPRSWTSIVTSNEHRSLRAPSTGLLDPRLPPRPMGSRTGSSPTTPSPDTADGSSRAAATEQTDRCTKSVSFPHRLGRRWAADRALLPTWSPSPGSAPPRPTDWTKDLLYNARHIGPPRPDGSPPPASCTAPPRPSRPIRPRPPRPGHSPDLPAIHDRPLRPSSRSLSR
jgi:hypothetical protein